MWKHSEGTGRPIPVTFVGDGTVQLTRNAIKVEATEEIPEHWEYESCFIPESVYAVYSEAQSQSAVIDELIIAILEG